MTTPDSNIAATRREILAWVILIGPAPRHILTMSETSLSIEFDTPADLRKFARKVGQLAALKTLAPHRSEMPHFGRRMYGDFEHAGWQIHMSSEAPVEIPDTLPRETVDALRAVR